MKNEITLCILTPEAYDAVIVSNIPHRLKGLKRHDIPSQSIFHFQAVIVLPTRPAVKRIREDSRTIEKHWNIVNDFIHSNFSTC
jgi:hypothetical protein